MGFGLLDQRENVAHAENPPHNSVGMKQLQGIVLFAHADELDGLSGDLANGKRRATTGVTIHLGEYHARERQFLVELVGRLHRVLAGHGVGNEEDLLRIEDLLQRLHLVHQLLVDVQPAGGVNDEHVAGVIDGLAAGFLHQPFDSRGVRFLDLAFVEMGLDGLGYHLELLACRRTVNVNRDQHGPVSALLEPVRQFARGSGLAGTLQTRHQHNCGRLGGELQLGRVFAEDGDQFVANNLDYLLGGGKRGQHFLAQRFLADVLDQFFDYVEVNVGFEQRHANFFQRFADVFFRQRTLSAQILKGTLQLICKVLKHCQESTARAGWAETCGFHAEIRISRRYVVDSSSSLSRRNRRLSAPFVV